jgi:NADPH:quinone reductase
MSDQKMKAVRVHRPGGPEVLVLEEVPRPEAGRGQVLVRVMAAGVNPVDTYIRSGSYARVPPHPFTPGSDAAGVVESAGDGVSRVRPGDRVYTARTLSGAYAEFVLCEEVQVHRLPEPVSFAQGAAIGTPYATAYRALLQRAAARAGEAVLVHGATGGVGTAAVQIARAAGMVVIGTGGSAAGREEALRQGAHHVLDHHAPGYLDRIPDLTGGRGVDVVLEMLADANLGRDLTVLATGGRVVVVGSRGSVELNPRDTMSRDAAILGMLLGNASPADLASIHAGLAAGLENGSLRPVVQEEIPLAEASRAHQRVMEDGHRGKIVLVPAAGR